MSNELVTVSVVFMHRTLDAILCKSEPGATGEWVPVSQIEDWDDLEEYNLGTDIEITIPEWLALEKGLI